MTNLLVNVKTALEGMPVTGLNGWLDSTVAFFWINGSGQFKQFVENWVQKICAQPEITWRHVPTKQNPADLASRGGDVKFRELWWHGPEWMSDSKCRPVPQVIHAFEARREQIKVQREVFAVAVDTTDRLDGVLEKFKLSKAININLCLDLKVPVQFLPSTSEMSGPLTTEEIRKYTYIFSG